MFTDSDKKEKTIDDVDYSPNDYGYYPDIQLNQTSEGVIFYIADPLNVSCSFEYVSFFNLLLVIFKSVNHFYHI